jgi:hypothetical protein
MYCHVLPRKLILLFALFWHETKFLTRMEEHSLEVFVNSGAENN